MYTRHQPPSVSGLSPSRSFRMLWVHIFLFLFMGCTASANRYYVAASGNDANAGTDSLLPIRTIVRANTLGLQAGDTLLFHAGEVFYGTLNLAHSGTALQPVYIGRFSAGADPVVTARRTITGWQQVSGQLYRCADTAFCGNLFMQGQMQVLARYPNQGFREVLLSAGNQYITDTALHQPAGFWQGATCLVHTADRILEGRLVDSSQNLQVKLHTPTLYIPFPHTRYFLQNLLAITDTAGEWYYDPVGWQLYFMAPGALNPAAELMEGAELNFGIQLQNLVSYIEIRHLRFESQLQAGIGFGDQSAYVVVDSCTFLHQYERGIVLPQQNLHSRIGHCGFYDITGCALEGTGCRGLQVSHNVMLRTGLKYGPGINTTGQANAMNLFGADSIVADHNLIDSCGNAGMLLDGEGAVIQENIFNHCMLRYNDGGGVVTGWNHAIGITIAHNFFLNTNGSLEGIYLTQKKSYGLLEDYKGQSCVIRQNTFAGNQHGDLFVNDSSTQNRVVQNTFYSGPGIALALGNGTADAASGNRVTGNIFYGIHEQASPLLLKLDTLGVPSLVTDSNTYFNPYCQLVPTISYFAHGYTNNQPYSLRKWRSLSIQDAHSRSSWLHWSRFIPTDTTGPNLFTNGSFDQNTDGWFTFPLTNNLLLLDNATLLDDGCARLAVVADTPTVRSTLIDAGFNLDSGQYYLLHLSSFSLHPADEFVYLSRNAGDYGGLTLPQHIFADTQRLDQQLIFKPDQSYFPGRFNLDMFYEDSITWFDNFKLLPVDVDYRNPYLYNRIFMNPSDSPRTFSLLDTTFTDTDSNQVTVSMTLAPWTSRVLYWGDAAIAVAPNAVASVAMPGDFSVFPNPVQAGEPFYMQSAQDGPMEYTWYSPDGRCLQSGSGNYHGVRRELIPPGWPAGIYLLKCRSEKRMYIRKIAVIK